MSCASIKAVLLNTKGIEFEVPGYYWGDGTYRIDNPRPERYADKYLYTAPDIFDEEDPKRLFWLADENSPVGELSPFRIKAAFVVFVKPSKKRGKVNGKARVQ